MCLKWKFKSIFKISSILIIATFLTLTFPQSSFQIVNISSEEEAFLDKMQKDIFTYFWAETNTENGLMKDSSRPGAPCSIAAVGFGLTSICIAEQRGWVERDAAYKRILTTLLTFRDKLPNEHGFFYHFIDMNSGQRVWNCEISSIDTALFLAGALFAGEYFKGTEIEKVADDIYRRVDWPWLTKDNIICMGWKPESGFLNSYWDSYSELMILYALAIGSPTHPIPPESWSAWERSEAEYGDYKMVYCFTGSLFVYQYSHAWIDFRKLDDKGINWFENSVQATKANRQFCIDNKDKFKTYGPNVWGITASTGPSGYKGYGAKPGNAFNDGTISPSGAGGSIVFTPRPSFLALKYMYDNYGDKIYDKYGFRDAFNFDRNWVSGEHLGISQGIMMLMIENCRTQMVWKYFMKNKYVKKWLDLCF